MILTDSTGDVALNKKAYQSSTWMDRNDLDHKAEMGVDGDVWTCSTTLKTPHPAWWVVDLGRPYHVARVYMEATVFPS